MAFTTIHASTGLLGDAIEQVLTCQWRQTDDDRWTGRAVKAALADVAFRYQPLLFAIAEPESAETGCVGSQRK
jgi:hypothetical protein